MKERKREASKRAREQESKRARENATPEKRHSGKAHAPLTQPAPEHVPSVAQRPVSGTVRDVRPVFV